MEGKTIASVDKDDDNMTITICFTDGTSVVIKARGRDSWLTMDHINPWSARGW